jgi:aminopeptidase N
MLRFSSRIPLLMLPLLLSLPTGVSAARVDRHQLHLELQPATQRMVAHDLISLAVTAPQPLRFELADHCQVTAVAIDGKPVRYRQAGVDLELLPETTDTAPLSVAIDYTATFAALPPAQPAHHEDPGYGVVASISPQGSYLSAGLAWFPRRDGVLQQLEIEISAPAGYHAVTAGRRSAFTSTAEAATSHWSLERPVNGLPLAAGPFEVHEASAGRIPVYAYFYPRSSALVADYLAATVAYLEFYAKRFGPYPFSKFAIVENFFPSGYGFPSWTLLGSSVIQLPFIVQTSLGHEVAHSWWGNGVQVDYAQGNWCEGLTTYVADYLYQEQESAAAARAYRLKILRDYATLRNSAEFPVTGFRARNDNLSQVIGYGKVAMLFHMLRQRVGNENFWATLKQLAAQRMFAQVGWAELLQRFAQVSGQALEADFLPWLQRPGAPQLQLSSVRLESTGDGWLISGTLRQLGEPWPLRVNCQLQTEAGSSSQTVTLDDAATDFAFRTTSRPLSLSVDPDADLLRLLEPMEIPASVNHLRASDRLLVVTLPGQDAALPALQVLLAALRQPGARRLSLADYRRQTPPAADLLFLGQPATEDLPPVLIDRPLVGPVDPQHAALTLLRQTEHPDRVVAIYQPGALEYAERVARKIPHYGKYSQLEFADGRNTLKRILAPPAQPLQIAFPLSGAQP